jgi:hypothetical protein
MIEGSTLTQDRNYYQDTRIALIDGLVGSAAEKKYLALQLPALPVLWAVHPVIPFLRVYRRHAEALDTGIVRVHLNYKLIGPEDGEPDEAAPAHIEIGTSLVETTTDKDVNNNQIIVSHKPIIDGQPGAEIIQSASVRFQQAVTVIKASRREPNHPGAKARVYVGTMNATPFESGGDPARYWLCTLILGVSDNGGQSYTVAYEFQRNPATWDSVVAYVDDETGRILTNLVQDESLRTYQILRETDFNALALGA